MKKILKITLSAFLGLSIIGCSSDDDSTTPTVQTEKSDVIENYANIVLANYQDSYNAANSLKTAIDAFVADPTETTFNAAKTAWKAAREPYGQTEAFRFASGPIDDEDGPEGLLNAWPLDEVYIDYVEGNAASGIVNNPTEYPTIDKATLVDLNLKDQIEENVSIGYHAIEFLLWGQDLDDPADNTAGQRPFTDFVDGGTAENQDRRRQYIAVCADLILDHLQLMLNEWENGGTYRTTFLALNEDVALRNILTAIGTLSASELATERMFVALDNQDQEDEHSCFSDNTDRDIRLNLQGIANVYRGSYGNITGPSIEDLIDESNATLGNEISTLLAAAESTVGATLEPFDLAISGGESSTEGAKVLSAVTALQNFGDGLVTGATAIGVTGINLE